MSEPLGPLDSIWLHLDAPENPMVITAVLWFEQPLPREVLVSVLEERLVGRYPRFRHRIVEPPVGPAWWEPDPAFTVEAHVTTETLAPPGDRAQLQELVSARMSSQLDLHAAPWEFRLVSGYRGGSAVVARLHHSLADGITLSRILLGLTDGHEPAPPGVRRHSDPVLHAVEEVVDLLAHPGRLAHHLQLGAIGALELERLIVLPFDARTPLRGPLGPTKRCAWVEGLPLDRVKSVGKRTGCTVNDVLVSVLAGALGEHLRARGSDPPRIRAMVPFDLRPDAGIDPSLGNHFSLVVVELPVGETDPVARLHAVHAGMAELKNGVQPAVVWALFQAIAPFPVAIERWFLDFMGKKGTAVCTNVPGPTERVALMGHEVGGVLVWVPQAGPIGIGLSVFSYAGEVTVGVTGDAGLLPDPGDVAARVPVVFDALCAAVGASEPS